MPSSVDAIMILHIFNNIFRKTCVQFDTVVIDDKMQLLGTFLSRSRIIADFYEAALLKE